jgi:hypothetical protein
LRPAAASASPARQTAQAAPDTGQFRVRDVESAAVEAGISRQYVALALAEIQARAARGEVVPATSERDDRNFTLFLGTADRALSVSRVIPGTPKAVLAALGQVFTQHASRMELVDTVNGHPLDGGILRFRMPRYTEAYVNPMAASTPGKALAYRLEQIELFDLNVTLQPRGTALAPACEVVVTGDLRSGLRRNLALDFAMMAGFAIAGGALGGVPTLAATAGGAVLLAGATAGVGALLGAAGGFVWYRWLFRRALAGAHAELGALLRSIEQYLTTQQLFSGEAPSRLPSPPADTAP